MNPTNLDGESAYAQTLRFLYELRWFGAKFGLENTRRLATLLNHPERRLNFIHVAGTNGKGSTCAMLESIYRHSGRKVGLFTSPHLVRFNERIQIDRRPITNTEVTAQVQTLQPLLQTFSPDHHPTFFEVVTAMALRHFDQHECDVVIWETGMGGRLDATNIVTPLASVITNIDYDHQAWLGNTLTAIAKEKAGIIKPGVPVITTTSEPEALAVLRDAARQHHANLIHVTEDSPWLTEVHALQLPLIGQHQRWNAALALATIHQLQSTHPVHKEAVRRGLASVDWAGRFQCLQRENQQVIVDGAHNPGGAQALAQCLSERFPRKSIALVLGLLQDKDWLRITDALLPHAHKLILVPVNSDRTASPDALAPILRQRHPMLEIATGTGVLAALHHLSHEPVVVVSGSLYLVGETLNLLQKETSTDERFLNEWQPKSSKLSQPSHTSTPPTVVHDTESATSPRSSEKPG